MCDIAQGNIFSSIYSFYFYLMSYYDCQFTLHSSQNKKHDNDEMTTTHSGSTSHVFIQLFSQFFMTLANFLHREWLSFNERNFITFRSGRCRLPLSTLQPSLVIKEKKYCIHVYRKTMPLFWWCKLLVYRLERNFYSEWRTRIIMKKVTTTTISKI